MEFDTDFFIKIALVCLIACAFLTLLTLKSDGGRCVADPMKYGLIKINSEAICTCTANGVKPYTFNKYGPVNYSSP